MMDFRDENRNECKELEDLKKVYMTSFSRFRQLSFFTG